jgi:hypothetical protein
VADESLLIHHKGRALRYTEDTQDAVKLRNRSPCIGEKREGEAQALSERFVLGRAVDADAEDLGLSLLKARVTSLVRLEFMGSGGRVGEDIKRQHNILLAAKITQLDTIRVLVRKLEIRRSLADLE